MSRSGKERGHKPLPKHWREVVAERDGQKCGLCGKDIGDVSRATLDHIIPRAHGGRDRLENLQLTHFRCNAERGTDGVTREMRQAQREGRLG